MAFQHAQTGHGADPPPTPSGESGVPAEHQPAGVLPYAPHPLNSPRALPPDLVGSASAPSPSSSATTASSPGESSSARSVAEDTSEVPPQAAAAPAKEQKKRGRVNPEQLAILEAIFAANRSPNAVRRKEISEQLGMTERQTQIWFQNRRAKEKQAGGKKPSIKGKSVAPKKPPSPIVLPARLQPILYPSQDTELQKRIREDDPVIVIPCTQLSIGSWVRVASTSGDATQRHDLLAYICEAQQRLTWFVRYREGNVEHAVRMDIALDTIADATLKPSSPSTSPTSPIFPGLGSTSEPTARVSLLLTHTPRFLMTVLPPDGGAPVWSPCGDWTEGCQASVVLRHELAGACAPLTYLWTRLHSGPARAPRTSPLITTRTASVPQSPHGPLLPTGLPSSGLPSPPTSALSELSLEQQLRSPVLSRRGSAYDTSYDPSYFPNYTTTGLYPTPRSGPPSSSALHAAPALPHLAIPPAPYALASALGPPFAPAPDPRLFTDALPHAWRGEYAAAFSAPAAFGGAHELFLPASLSRRSFSHAAPPRSVPVQYLATPPPSHSRSGQATPGGEGFPWAQVE